MAALRFSAGAKIPVVVSGFEPLDLLQSIQFLVRQLNEGRCEVENQYTRGVTREGNLKAQALVDTFFELRPSFEWRGLGTLPDSALRLKAQWAKFDAEQRKGQWGIFTEYIYTDRVTGESRTGEWFITYSRVTNEAGVKEVAARMDALT